MSEERMRLVRPQPGRTVIDPATRQQLPEAGARVRWGSFWAKRLREGDITIVRPQDEIQLEAPTLRDLEEN